MRGGWLCFCLSMLMLLGAVEALRKCPSSVKYQPPGRSDSCAKCAKGMFVVEDCLPGVLRSTKCQDCKEGTYQDCLSGSRKCRECKPKCEINQVELRPCEKTHDLECGCKVDHAKSMRGDELVCTPCAKPNVVQSKGETERCQECSDDWYYLKDEKTPNVSATCQRCTECEKYKKPCSVDEDAICDEVPAASRNNAGLIAGVVVGVFILIIMIIVGVICWRRRNKDPPNSDNHPLDEVDQSLISPREANGSVPSTEIPSHPEINGKDAVIVKTIHWLSQHLGHDWKSFIRHLPASGDFINQRQATIQQSEINHPNNAPEQIYEGLTKWTQKCPGDVTTENILRALWQAKEELWRLPDRDPAMRPPEEIVHDLHVKIREWILSSSSPEGASGTGSGRGNDASSGGSNQRVGSPSQSGRSPSESSAGWNSPGSRSATNPPSGTRRQGQRTPPSRNDNHTEPAVAPGSGDPTSPATRPQSSTKPKPPGQRLFGSGDDVPDGRPRDPFVQAQTSSLPTSDGPSTRVTNRPGRTAPLASIEDSRLSGHLSLKDSDSEETPVKRPLSGSRLPRGRPLDAEETQVKIRW